MIEIVRTSITATLEGAIKRFSGSGRTDETFGKREAFQHYGFTSRATAGAEGLVIDQNGVVYLVAEDDRRYRLAIEEGEVALYSDEGDYIRFCRGNKLAVHTGGKLQIDAAHVIDLRTNTAQITAGMVQVDGSLSVSGNIKAGTGVSCTFTTLTGQVVTVQDGIVIGIA